MNLSNQANMNGADSFKRVTSILLKDVGGSAYREQTYAYDAASKIQTYKLINSVTPTDLQHIDYDYYSDGSLKSEDHIGTSNDVSYSYYTPGSANGHGNLRYRKQGPLLSPTTVDEYFYANHDELDHITRGGGSYKSYSYDDNGRTTDVTTPGPITTSFTYDDSDRVSGITYQDATVDSFDYNAMDTRLSKTEHSVGTDYNRSGPGVTAPVLSDSCAIYTPGISESRSSTTTYQHSGIKNTAYQTDSGGSVSAIKEYDAFGNDLATSGSWQGPFGYGSGFGYQSTDRSGLMLLGHRYYDPSTGRFLTPDPIKDGGNWYEYCGGDPLGSADPSGLKNLGPWGGAVLQRLAPDRFIVFYMQSQETKSGDKFHTHQLMSGEREQFLHDADYAYTYNVFTREVHLYKIRNEAILYLDSYDPINKDRVFAMFSGRFLLYRLLLGEPGWEVEPWDPAPNGDPNQPSFFKVVSDNIDPKYWPSHMTQATSVENEAFWARFPIKHIL